MQTLVGSSTIPVTALGCMVACDMADACAAFSYNPTVNQCFLKANSSATTCKVRGMASLRRYLHRSEENIAIYILLRFIFVSFAGSSLHCYHKLEACYCELESSNQEHRNRLLHRCSQAPELACYASDGSLYSCGTWQTYYRNVSDTQPRETTLPHSTSTATSGSIQLVEPENKGVGDGQPRHGAASESVVALVTAFG